LFIVVVWTRARFLQFYPGHSPPRFMDSSKQLCRFGLSVKRLLVFWTRAQTGVGNDKITLNVARCRCVTDWH
jgi:hypothetical protein